MSNLAEVALIDERPWPGEAILYLLFKYPHLDAELMNPDWFDMEWYKPIYRAIVEWRISGKEADITAFCQGELSGFFGVYSKCEKFGVAPTFFDSYCQMQKQGHVELSVWQLGEDIKAAKSDEEAVDLVCEFADRARAARVGPSIASFPKDYAVDYLEALEKARDAQDIDLAMGFPQVDKWTHGLHRGELTVVGARPGIGKSTFMLNVASTMLKKRKKTLFFSTEMSVMEQWSRLIPIMTGIEAFKFRKASFDDSEWGRVTDKTQWLAEENNFIVCDLASPKIEQVANLVHKCKPDLVILDYLQRFTMPDADRMDLAIGEFLKQVKTLSRTENCSIMVASQLNRSVETRNIKIPTLSDLRESGNIEQEADVVLLMAVSDDFITTKEIMLGIAKNRHGQTGSVKISFLPKTLQMLEMSIA